MVIKPLIVTLILGAAFLGCGLSGHYVSHGPCEGFHKNIEACKRAWENSQAVALVKIGMSMELVTKTMNRIPEQRTANENKETWSYLTDYDAERMTTIIFKDNIVVGLEQAPWTH